MIDTPIDTTNTTTSNTSAPPEESWIERERRIHAEREIELAQRRSAAEHAFEARLARARAVGCDDGRGLCRYCGCVLGADHNGTATHPNNACEGPPPTCDVCGKPLSKSEGNAKRYVSTCTPEDHLRATSHITATGTAFGPARAELVRPVRVRRDIDDVD